MKLENNDSVLKQHDEVKGLPHDDTVVFRSVPLTPKSIPADVDVEFHGGETVVAVTSEETGRAFRIRDMNDFC
jgi:folate-dependent tRNA-U54 methylase TrmFO/GidA